MIEIEVPSFNVEFKQKVLYNYCADFSVKLDLLGSGG